jgi:hypothetical protein
MRVLDAARQAGSQFGLNVRTVETSMPDPPPVPELSFFWHIIFILVGHG